MKKILAILSILALIASPAFASSYYSRNSPTATALAANGANCGAGQVAAGVDASGAAEGCLTPVTAETDPQVGTLTNTKWCTTDGTDIDCATNAPVLTESDPTVDTSGEVVTIIGAGVYATDAQGSTADTAIQPNAVTANGASCTITAIVGGQITGASCV